jgi:endonuclease/exonuclease/phosphatase family metal-dependent hydrolase
MSLRNALLVLLLSLLCQGCAVVPLAPAEARGAPAFKGSVPVTLAAWNVANFFDTVDDANRDEVLTPAQWEKKLAQLSHVVDVLDADFLALEEVENLDCLRALNGRLEKPYPELGLIQGNDTQRGIDVAFMTRLPVSRVVSHRDYDLPDDAPGVSKRYKFSRDCLQVELATSPAATLLVNHFKSQLGGKKKSAGKRRVQAEAVVAIAAEAARLHPDGFEVVLGDLNDRPEAWSLEPLQEAMRDVFAGWPEKLRATHRSKHGRTPLDHIFVSPDAEGRLEGARVWQDLGKGASDHDPVSVRVRLDKAPAGKIPLKVWGQGAAPAERR